MKSTYSLLGVHFDAQLSCGVDKVDVAVYAPEVWRLHFLQALSALPNHNDNFLREAPCELAAGWSLSRFEFPDMLISRLVLRTVFLNNMTCNRMHALLTKFQI
jgi:hypothetical protein